jgi:NADH-quinone oxidoreductase subunit F
VGLRTMLLAGTDEHDLTKLAEYRAIGGYEQVPKALAMTSDELIAELQKANLRGRGGAGFPMGRKASLVDRKSPKPKYLVVNADESEPGAFKDREVMARVPHRLLEGCLIAAQAIESKDVFIYIRGEYLAEYEILQAAVDEAREAGLFGEVNVTVYRGAGAYICGEETALLDSLEGKRGNPRLKPPFPANQGLYQGPTLINNVETLNNVPLVIANGSDWFKQWGTEQSAGTKVVSVSGNVQRPGNYEIELGIPAREIIYDLAGGPPPGRKVKLWFPGGSSAPVLTEEDLDRPYSFESMAEAGSMLGSGAIIVVDDSIPVVSVALRLAQFYRHESCGKCVPCREGTNWTVKMLERIDTGEATPMDLDIMAAVQTNIIGNCLCVLGDSMAMPVGSMIQKFRPEFEEHIERAREAADMLSVEMGVAAPPADAAA